MRELVEKLHTEGWATTSGAVTAESIMLQKAFGEVTVSMTLREDGDFVELHRIRALPEFHGGGKAGLKELCACADDISKELTLRVRPFGSKALNEQALERLYKSVGFEEDPYAADYTAMVRYPEDPALRPS